MKRLHRAKQPKVCLGVAFMAKAWAFLRVQQLLQLLKRAFSARETSRQLRCA